MYIEDDEDEIRYLCEQNPQIAEDIKKLFDTTHNWDSVYLLTETYKVAPNYYTDVVEMINRNVSKVSIKNYISDAISGKTKHILVDSLDKISESKNASQNDLVNIIRNDSEEDAKIAEELINEGYDIKFIELIMTSIPLGIHASTIKELIEKNNGDYDLTNENVQELFNSFQELQ